MIHSSFGIANLRSTPETGQCATSERPCLFELFQKEASDRVTPEERARLRELGITLDRAGTPPRWSVTRDEMNIGAPRSADFDSTSMVPGGGFEPPIHGFTDRCLRPLGYPGATHLYHARSGCSKRPRSGALFVRGLDAIDGTPVLDVKPYVPAFDRVDNATVPAWMDELMRGHF